MSHQLSLNKCVISVFYIMPEEKSFETKEGEVERREVSKKEERELRREEKNLSAEKKEQKRREAIKKEIEQEFEEEKEEELESHRQKIEEKLEDLEKHFLNLAYDDINKALKAIKGLDPHKKDKAIDTLCRDKVFWHLVRTGQIDYGIKS